MTPAPDEQVSFDELLLREAARLLPGVDFVRLEQQEPSRRAVDPAVARRQAVASIKAAASHLVGMWSVVFGSGEHPDSVSIGWSSLGAPDVVHARAAARLVMKSGESGIVEGLGRAAIDPDAVAVTLGRAGWATTVRSSSERGFSVLGRLGGFRVDVVVDVDQRLRAVRVTGPAVAVGDVAAGLTDAGWQEIRWPA